MKKLIAFIALAVFAFTGLANMAYALNLGQFLQGAATTIIKEIAREKFEELLNEDPQLAALYGAYKQGSEDACRQADERYQGACRHMRQKVGR